MKFFKDLGLKIANNKFDLIKACIIYPLILITHYLSGKLLYAFPYDLQNLEDNLMNEVKVIFSFAFQLNLLFIISILTVSYAVKSSTKDMYTLFLVTALYLPIALLAYPQFSLLACLVGDYYICWMLVKASKKWKSISIFNFKISSQWIGFLGTILSTLISTLLSKK